jgi:hypothetical protein
MSGLYPDPDPYPYPYLYPYPGPNFLISDLDPAVKNEIMNFGLLTTKLAQPDPDPKSITLDPDP